MTAPDTLWSHKVSGSGSVREQTKVKTLKLLNWLTLIAFAVEQVLLESAALMMAVDVQQCVRLNILGNQSQQIDEPVMTADSNKHVCAQRNNQNFSPELLSAPACARILFVYCSSEGNQSHLCKKL